MDERPRPSQKGRGLLRKAEAFSNPAEGRAGKQTARRREQVVTVASDSPSPRASGNGDMRRMCRWHEHVQARERAQYRKLMSVWLGRHAIR